MVNCIMNSIHANATQIVIDCKDNQIIIEDNGHGIDSTANVFERGFTTKKDGQGIGLSISKHNLQEIGGDLLLDARKGPTRFIIKLPS